MRWVFALVLLIAACQPAPRVADSNIVQWNRSPQTIVFRADIVGGESDFRARSVIPNCTIYGDNRIVWANELGPFQIQALEDRLSDSTIDAFVRHLAVDERIYTYGAHLKDIQTEANPAPVVETITLNVDDIEHQGDSLGGWDTSWFPRVLGACKSLSQAPVLIAPSGGWLSAQSVPYSMQPPLATWNPQAMGVSLASIADGMPRWISGAAVTSLWNTLHSLPTNLIFEEGTRYYAVALQVPDVTRDAPPAPSS